MAESEYAALRLVASVQHFAVVAVLAILVAEVEEAFAVLAVHMADGIVHSAVNRMLVEVQQRILSRFGLEEEAVHMLRTIVVVPHLDFAILYEPGQMLVFVQTPV